MKIRFLALLLTCVCSTTSNAVAPANTSPDSPLISSAELSKRKELDKEAVETKKLDGLVGKQFWIVPKPKAPIRVSFYETTSQNPSITKDFHVAKETSFKVLAYQKEKYGTNWLILIEFEDGTNAYVKTTTRFWYDPAKNHPFEGVLYGTYINLPEYTEVLYSAPPSEIRAKQIKKQAEQKERQQKAQAEWDARGPVTIGMTKQQVLSSNWGAPLKTETAKIGSTDRDVWTFARGRSVYFKDGVVVRINQ